MHNGYPSVFAGRFGRRSAIGVALALVASCTPGADLPPLPNYDGTTYRLGVGDQVRLITFGVESLTGTFRVNDSGEIELPLFGAFHGAGLTTRELQTTLSAELVRRKLLNSPSISVEVVEYRPIFVLGEVNRPGQFPYQPGMKVLTAIAVAGGFTYRAVQGHARVLRSIDAATVTGRVDPDAFAAPGDVITVLERYF